MRLAELDHKTGHQLVVAVFKSLDGESLEDYTNRLFRAWKPGSKKADDGLLFAVYVGDRRWRVEVGYGLEPVLTDLQAAEIARAGVPFFQSGDYAGGVSAVVDGLSAVLTGTAPAPRPQPMDEDEYDTLVTGVVWGGLIFVLIFLVMRGGGGGGTIGRRGGRGYGGFGGFGGLGGLGGGGFGGGGFGGGGGFIGGGGMSGGGGASGGW